MKVGDKVPVNIGMHVVAQAEVKNVNTKDSTATLVVPATLVVMGVRTELTDLPSTEPATETIISGVEAPNEPVESAAVGETLDNSASNANVVESIETVSTVEGTAAEPVADAGDNIQVQEPANNNDASGETETPSA